MNDIMYEINIIRIIIKYYYNIYHVNILNGKNIKPIKKNDQFNKNFSEPETLIILKIYMIFSNEYEVLYIGETNQSITNRLRQGLNPTHNSGYKGYKWSNYKKVYIHCISIPNCDKEELQALEAELVFLFRKKNNKWPLCQNKIHFFNKENINLLAEELFHKHIEKCTVSHNKSTTALPLVSNLKNCEIIPEGIL